MSNELTVMNDLAVMPIMDIGLAVQRRNQIVGFVKEIMIENTDFGVIPGTTGKPTLYKPGAEKLATFFGLTKRFEIIERVEDWTGEAHKGEPFFYYLYRCSLLRGDFLIAEADGSCSSFESKYRYRKAERICPSCQQPAIINGKEEYGGGYVCFAKKGGCGAKFKKGDEQIESQKVGRMVNPDVCDQVNTIQKMAQKRALVGVVLLAVNASEFFTQDLEDYVESDYMIVEHQTVKPEPQKRSPVAQPVQQPPTEPAIPKEVKPKKKPQWATACQAFYDDIQRMTDNYYDEWKFLQVMENLGLTWSFLSDPSKRADAESALTDHARQRRSEKEEAK